MENNGKRKLYIDENYINEIKQPRISYEKEFYSLSTKNSLKTILTDNCIDNSTRDLYEKIGTTTFKRIKNG